MASKRDIAEDLGGRWDRAADGYERQARYGEGYSSIEKRLLEMHARVLRACATELRLEGRKVTRG